MRQGSLSSIVRGLGPAWIVFLILPIWLGLGSPAAAESAGDANAGRDVFKKCAACHRIEPGRKLIGPSLFGVAGRKAGSLPGFAYSPALKNSGIEWTDDQLDRWLTDPKAMVPGTKMTFPGLKDPKDRENVIAYLKHATD